MLVGAYSGAGYVMAGSFAVANPARHASYRTAASVYLVLMAISVAGGVAAVVSLLRRRRPGRSAASHLRDR
jgi:hypothetical protein